MGFNWDTFQIKCLEVVKGLLEGNAVLTEDICKQLLLTTEEDLKRAKPTEDSTSENFEEVEDAESGVGDSEAPKRIDTSKMSAEELKQLQEERMNAAFEKRNKKKEKGQKKDSQALSSKPVKSSATSTAPKMVNSSVSTSSPISVPATENKSDEEDENDVSKITFTPNLPPRPFYKTIVERIMVWGRDKAFPIKLQRLPFFEKSINFDVLNRVNDLTGQVVQLSQCASDDMKLKTALIDLLNKLGVRGLMTLLGIQCTTGSADVLPPSRDMLIKSFNEKDNAQSSLSVGARALSKHFHRGTEKWWGEIQGSEASKNNRATVLLLRFMRGAVWLNIHGLPGQVKVLEMRLSNGYGARWTADGQSFRGFLEPHMVDGWKTGWKH